jgi:hypothetical protein
MRRAERGKKIRKEESRKDELGSKKEEGGSIAECGLTRDLPIARSPHHATNAVYPAASPHAVLRNAVKLIRPLVNLTSMTNVVQVDAAQVRINS